MYWDRAQIIGANLRKLRRDNGLTIQELAKKLNTAPSNVTHLEQGKHSNPEKSPLMPKICNYFGVNPKALLSIKSWGDEDE